MKRLLVSIAGVAFLFAGVAFIASTPTLLAAPQSLVLTPVAIVSPDPSASFPSSPLAGAPVLLAEGWSTPVNVSFSPGPSGSPVLAVDSTGVAHLAWYDNNPGNWEILYSSRPLPGPWSPAENVSANASYSLVPSMVIEPDDSVNIAWQDYGGPRIAWQGTLLSKAREAGQDFAPPEAISSTAGYGGYPEVRDPNLAVDSQKTIHLAWAGNTAGGYRIFYARKPDGGVWTFPRVIHEGSGNSFRPRLAVDAGDVLHVVWQEMLSSNTQIDVYYSRLIGNDVWATPTNLSQNTGDSQEPGLLIGADGTLHVVWRDNSLSADQADILYMYKPLAGAWSPIADVSNTAGDSAGPVLVEDAAATLHLAWYDNTPGNWEILYATRPLAGSWSSGANVSHTAGRSGQPSLFYDKAGKLHLAWADDTTGKVLNNGGCLRSIAPRGRRKPRIRPIRRPQGPMLHVSAPCSTPSTTGEFDIYYLSKVNPVFSTSFKQASATSMVGENIGYTIVARNPSALAITVFVTDTMPGETTYLPGSASAGTGIVAASGGQVTWAGVVPAHGQAEIRYVALNDEIHNHAEISNASGATISVEASTRVVLVRPLLPIIVQAY